MNTFLSLYGTLNSALVFLMVDVTIMSVLFSIGTDLIILLTVTLGVVSGMMTLVVYFVYKPFAKMIFPTRAYAVALYLTWSNFGTNTRIPDSISRFWSGCGFDMSWNLFQNNGARRREN